MHCVVACYSYLITQHPVTEQRVLEELGSAGLLVTPTRPKPRQMVWEDLTKLTFLSCAIKVRCAPSCELFCSAALCVQLTL